MAIIRRRRAASTMPMSISNANGRVGVIDPSIVVRPGLFVNTPENTGSRTRSPSADKDYYGLSQKYRRCDAGAPSR